MNLPSNNKIVFFPIKTPDHIAYAQDMAMDIAAYYGITDLDLVWDLIRTTNLKSIKEKNYYMWLKCFKELCQQRTAEIVEENMDAFNHVCRILAFIEDDHV